MSTQRPNIILINCDDLGYGDIGCYGSTLNKTPGLDKMAEEGMRMTDFYMVSPVCSPSRGGMLTGCYAERIGFDNFDGRAVLFPGQRMGLNPSENTISSLLKKEGYATKMVGKWHCGDQKEFLPTKHGFDSYFGIPYSNDMGRQACDRSCWVQQLQEKSDVNYLGKNSKELDTDYPPLPLMRDDEVKEEQPNQAALTDRYLEEATGFIREAKDEPFFLYFAHMYVHLPIYVPEPWVKKSENGRYGAAVEHIDYTVSAIIEELKTQGIDDNTLIIFTSDNGSRASGEGGSNEPCRGTKCQTWEGGQRVPCIIRYPNKIPSGITSDAISASIDFLPTILGLVGGTVPATPIIDGKNIADIWQGEEGAAPAHDAFFYYFFGRLEAVRTKKWKLHFTKGEKECNELYDLSEDVSEANNVYDKFPNIVKELTEVANKKRIELGDSLLGIKGTQRRPHGIVENNETLTHFNADNPYFMVEYDLEESG